MAAVNADFLFGFDTEEWIICEQSVGRRYTIIE